MRTLSRVIVWSLAVTVGVVGFGFGSAAASGPHCNLTVSGENVGNTAVQSAINSAHAGWTICLGHGVFPEQLKITTPRLTIVGSGAAQTTIEPTTGVQNAVDFDSGGALVAVVQIDNVSGVVLAGLTVNASLAAASIGGCTPGIVAVDFQNVTMGRIASSVVTGAEVSPALLGCQSQTDIYAYTGYFSTHYTPLHDSVVVTASQVTAYGKGGIVCDDPGLSCAVSSTKVVGIGVTPAIAANGIQVAYGAIGHLVYDRVSANAYDGTDSALNWYGTSPNSSTVGYQSSGILLYQAGAGTRIANCVLTSDADGIAAYQDVADQIVGNTVIDSSAYAIVENGVPTTTALVAFNSIGNPEYDAIGILLDNGTFHVADNHIASVSATGSQGPSQPVAGPGTFFPTATAASIRTAGVQAVSEGGATIVIFGGNVFLHVSTRLSTLAIFAGTVTIV